MFTQNPEVNQLMLTVRQLQEMLAIVKQENEYLRGEIQRITTSALFPEKMKIPDSRIVGFVPPGKEEQNV